METMIAPKYQIGSTVYYPTTVTTAGRHECPDCLGTKKWTCKSPAGLESDMDCPRCQRSGGWNDNLSLSYTQHVPHVRKLTIGSVRTDSAAEHPVSYMAKETGVGSGSVYYESNLFDDEQSAMAYAIARCAELQAEQNMTPETMKVAEHSRLGYFDSLRRTMEQNAERAVRESFANHMDESVEESGLTPGVWHVSEGSLSDDGVYSFTIMATDPATGAYGLQICSGYGGLSSCFASRTEGPANARVLAASKELLAACQRAFDQTDKDARPADWEMLRAAIAKAITPAAQESEP